jgi:ABC-type amino acid transport/signal transduction systems, periplasmic component/domain
MLLRCFVFIFFVTPSVFAAKTVKMATYPIPLMVENEDKGIFVQLAKELGLRTQQKIVIEVKPASKSILAFSTGEVDAIFPGLDVIMPKNCAKSEPFYLKTDFIFYRTDKPLRDLKHLEGKKVGLTFRYPYAKELTANKKIKFELAPNDVVNMKKLASGAIDAFVVEERSGLEALKVSGEKNISYDKERPLSKQSVYFAFQNNSEGEQLAEKFSKAILEMKKDGSFDRIINATPATATATPPPPAGLPSGSEPEAVDQSSSPNALEVN